MSATTQQAQSDSTQQPTQVQRPAVLEEDDEFEDFPIEGELLFFSSLNSSWVMERNEQLTNDLGVCRLAARRDRARSRRDRQQSFVGGELG